MNFYSFFLNVRLYDLWRYKSWLLGMLSSLLILVVATVFLPLDLDYFQDTVLHQYKLNNSYSQQLFVKVYYGGKINKKHFHSLYIFSLPKAEIS